MRMKRSNPNSDESSVTPVTEDKILVNLRCSAIVFRNDTVLLCHRPNSDGTWVLPGGTPRLGEGTAIAAQREVEEETGLQLTIDRIAFVLETTDRDWSHHLIEIVFVGKERNANAAPRQRESGLLPSFVPLEELDQIRLRPPIAGYVRGFYRYRRTSSESQHLFTAAYLGNLWRVPEKDEPGAKLSPDF